MSELDQKLADAVADQRISADDAAAVHKFAEFLEYIGPKDSDQPKRIRAYMNLSPENRSFVLGGDS